MDKATTDAVLMALQLKDIEERCKKIIEDLDKRIAESK